MRILFQGAPLSGKGTYASRIASQLNLPHISVGNVLQAQLKNPKYTDVIKKYKLTGGVVPDKETMEILHDRLRQDDCKNGFILESLYTVAQAEQIDQDPTLKPDIVVFMNTPISVLKKRVTGRRICEKCGRLYNLNTTLKPKKPGVCDGCGGRIIQRKEDGEEAFRIRMEHYAKREDPLIQYYKNSGRYLEARWSKSLIRAGEADMDPNLMAEKILGMIKIASAHSD